MNRRQAIKTGITATAAILTMTGCKGKPESLTVKRLCEIRDGMKAKEQYGRSQGLEAINNPTRQWAESMAQASNKSTDDILIKAIEVI